MAGEVTQLRPDSSPDPEIEQLVREERRFQARRAARLAIAGFLGSALGGAVFWWGSHLRAHEAARADLHLDVPFAFEATGALAAAVGLALVLTASFVGLTLRRHGPDLSH